MDQKLSPAEQLAEPTPSDIAQRLADDLRVLRKRIDDFAGPLDDDLECELRGMGRSVDAVLTHGR